jgi:predicted transcriptional regulator
MEMTENVEKIQIVKKPHRLPPKVRIEKVFELTVKGFTIYETAKILNVSTKTVERDREKARKKQVKRIEELRKELRPEVRLLEHIEIIKEMRRLLWKAFDAHKVNICSVIRELRKLADQEVEYYVKLGWLPGKAATKRIIRRMQKGLIAEGDPVVIKRMYVGPDKELLISITDE